MTPDPGGNAERPHLPGAGQGSPPQGRDQRGSAGHGGGSGAAKPERLRPAGWVYSYPQEHTIPLYRCYNPQDQSHFASNEADCEKLGTMERLLGYALRR